MFIETRPEIDFSTFPDSDGKPVAETEINFEQMLDLILTLRKALRPQGHHVGGNLLMYWDPTDGWKHCSPDVFVALDAGPAQRKSWKVWEEGKFPEVVFEIVSPSTQKEDIGGKVALYDDLGVLEYYIFDPAGVLDPAYRGYQRHAGALTLAANPTGGSIISAVLDLEFRVVGGVLRAIDLRTERMLPTMDEAIADLEAEALEAQLSVKEVHLRLAQEGWARLKAERHATEEEQARLVAERRAAEEERARHAAEQARHAAEQARLAAERRAVEEEQARLAAEAEVARLREALARLGGNGTPPLPPPAR